MKKAKIIMFILVILSIAVQGKAMVFKSDEFIAQWDTWTYYHDDTYYLYYLITEHSNGEGFGVASSSNGVHWTDHGEVLHQSDENSFYLGTGSVWKSVDFETSGKFICNYSEHRYDGGQRQNILFAWSTDLINWTKYGDEYMFKVNTDYYDEFGRWDCIYAFPRTEGGYWGTWTASSKVAGQGGVGVGYSEDGLNWTALPFAISYPGVWESGAIYPVNGKYYGMFGSMGMVSHVADNFEGPYYQSPTNGVFLHPGPTYFSRFLPMPNDELLVNHHSMSGIQVGSRLVTYAAPLKKAIVDAEGIMRWKYWQGNDALKGDSVTLQSSSADNIQMITEELNFNKGVVFEADVTMPTSGSDPASVIFNSYGIYYAVRILENGIVQMGTCDSSALNWNMYLTYDRQWDYGASATLRVLARAGMMEVYLDDQFIECWTMGCYGSKNVTIGLVNGQMAIQNVKVWQMSLADAKAPLLIEPIPATATASSFYDGDYIAAYAVDGSLSTRWCSDTPPGTQEWLQLDFGSEQGISGVSIDWEVAYASGYDLKISNDGIQWQLIDSITNGDGGNDLFENLSITGRYLKIDCLERGSEHGYSIWEVKAFPETPDTPVTNDYPNIIEDTATTYSGVWTEYQDSMYHGGSCHYGNEQNAYFEATFIGSAIQWHGLKNVDLGYADIYIDDVLVADNLDCYGTIATQMLFEETGLADGEHTIRVATTGAKNPDSSGTYLVHDYFEYFDVPEPASLGLLGLSLLLLLRRK